MSCCANANGMFGISLEAKAVNGLIIKLLPFGPNDGMIQAERQPRSACIVPPFGLNGMAQRHGLRLRRACRGRAPLGKGKEKMAGWAKKIWPMGFRSDFYC